MTSQRRVPITINVAADGTVGEHPTYLVSMVSPTLQKKWSVAHRFGRFRYLNDALNKAESDAITAPFPPSTVKSKLRGLGIYLSAEEQAQRALALQYWIRDVVAGAGQLRPEITAAIHELLQFSDIGLGAVVVYHPSKPEWKGDMTGVKGLAEEPMKLSLAFLSAVDLLHTWAVCSGWRELGRDDYLWWALCEQHRAWLQGCRLSLGVGGDSEVCAERNNINCVSNGTFRLLDGGGGDESGSGGSPDWIKVYRGCYAKWHGVMQTAQIPRPLEIPSLRVRLLLVGCDGAGKTSFMTQLANGNMAHERTLGVDSRVIFVRSENITFQVMIWDSVPGEFNRRFKGGKAIFRSLTSMYHNADVVLFFFEKTSRTSLECLAEYYDEAQRVCTNVHQEGSPKVLQESVMLVGTKSDLATTGSLVIVAESEGRAFANERGMPYAECSSLTGEGLAMVFAHAARKGLDFKRRKTAHAEATQQPEANPAHRLPLCKVS